MIDQIFHHNLTVIEELVTPLDPSKPLHLMLASPGGDGEVAVRIVRSLQARCSDLTVLIPDMAKSAATILCLGADRLIFGPGGDLGPVDPQMRYPNGTLASAKELVEAVDEVERRSRPIQRPIPCSRPSWLTSTCSWWSRLGTRSSGRKHSFPRPCRRMASGQRRRSGRWRRR
ncbi:MAG: SDH family Clp fold serine proteinase [Jatrophihabitantaceae bacterium]